MRMRQLRQRFIQPSPGGQVIVARTVGKPLVKRYTENLKAYHLYLKGRFQWNKRTEESFYKSLGYYEQAIRIDPNYAPAYAGMADAYIMLARHGVVRAH